MMIISTTSNFVIFFYRLLGAGHRKASTAEVLEIETSDNFKAMCLQYKHYPPIAGQYEWWYQHLAWGKENKLINCGNFGIQNLQQCWGVSTNQSIKSCTLALKPWSELASHGSQGSRLTRQLAWVRLRSQYFLAWLLTHILILGASQGKLSSSKTARRSHEARWHVQSILAPHKCPTQGHDL